MTVNKQTRTKIVAVREDERLVDQFKRLASQRGGHAAALRAFIRRYVKRHSRAA